MHRRFAVFLLGLALAAPATAAGPYLVADLNTTPSPGDGLHPYGVDWVEVGGVLYFTADDGLHGHELWRTDGTPEGTAMVRDLCPGLCSSGATSLAAFGEDVAFVADDGVHGLELWLSDGTNSGTRMPGELCPGACPYAGLPGGLVAAAGRLFFRTQSQTGSEYGLAVSDGTAEGTRILLQSAQPIAPLAAVGGRLAFIGPGLGWYSSLWWSDGTPEGTVQALDLCTGSGPGCYGAWLNAQVLGDRLVFFLSSTGGWETWVSDGTAAGTHQIGHAPPPNSPAGGGVVLWQGALYYVSVDSLWRTDGTAAGTTRLRTWGLTTRPESLVAFGDQILFTGWDATQGTTLWRTRGTPETTTILSDPAPSGPSPVLGPLTRVGNRVLFPVVGAETSEIWETDGTTAGTRRRTGLCGTPDTRCPAGRLGAVSPAALGDRYLFGLADQRYGVELWTAGAAGPRLVRDLGRDPGSSRFPSTSSHSPWERPARDVASVGNRIVFSARTTPEGTASLWATDGTAAGTAEVGPAIEWPNGLVGIGDRVWLRGSFTDLPYLAGKGLWTTDGTPAGTVEIVQNLWIDSLPGGRPGQILFGAIDLSLPWDQQVDHELWTSDGAPDRFHLLKDINQVEIPSPIEGPPLSASFPAGFETLGALTLFSAEDGLTGREPWITDGTTAGTRLLLDINPGAVTHGEWVQADSSLPGPFVRFGDRLWFAADDGISGRELWATDGTPAGTVRARDLRPGAPGSDPRDLATAGGRLFFLADAGPSDALFTVSPAGLVTRVRLLGNGRRASSLVAAGSRLFFVVEGSASGRELWTSDGTRRGTRLVREIRPGALGSYPQELTAVGGLLLFAADDGLHGLEPWVSDGTAAGTHLLADLAPGSDASSPAHFTIAGDLIGFDADDGVHGREMWAVRKGELP
jgi:large repetitive protein